MCPSAALVRDSDHLQLTRLVTEISWRIDHGKANTVHELFTPDGVLHMGESTFAGRTAIQEWGRGIVEGRAYDGIRHVSTNMRFVAEGDDAAAGVSIVTVYLADADGQSTTVPLTVGEDNDRFVRTGHGWRIASRTWNSLFLRQ